MIELRPFASLGGGEHGWLHARHHFSFGDYRDPARVNWGALRVWNDDSIAPGAGFPMHEHEEMEIITYVRQGAITHSDSVGNCGRTDTGDVQVMSAGSGISHSEYNLEDEVTRIFQIWLLPSRHMAPPSWATRRFPRADRNGRFVVLASGYPEDAVALELRADARLLGVTLTAGQRVALELGAGRFAYLVPASGRVSINHVVAAAGDGVALRDVEALEIEALQDSEILIVNSA